MAKKITIPVTNHNADGICTIHYKVGYKLTSEDLYTEMPPVLGDTIEIANLAADATYNIRIIRFCCDGLQSAPLLLEVNT